MVAINGIVASLTLKPTITSAAQITSAKVAIANDTVGPKPNGSENLTSSAKRRLILGIPWVRINAPEPNLKIRSAMCFSMDFFIGAI